MSNNVWTNEFNPFNSWKLLCWYDHMQAIASGQFMPPVNIALDVIQGSKDRKLCGGLRCNFCMSDLEDKSEEARIPRDLLFGMPRFFKEWGTPSLCLAGHHSDTLAYNHEDLIEFLRLSNKNGIEIGFVSNGKLLTEYIIPDIVRNCKWTGFSINAGTPKTYMKITGSVLDTFNRTMDSISRMTDYCKEFRLNHPICFKFLITDDNYMEILDAVRVARNIGCRYIQIRPCELPEFRSDKIDTRLVDDQLHEALSYEIPGKFEVFGIREKFTANFKKKLPYKCVASPLGSTWKANGDIVICPDRRWSAHLPDMVMGNFITEGLEAIRRKWGGPEHLRMIKAANADMSNCIRCTSYQWNEIYRNTVESDPLDVKLI